MSIEIPSLEELLKKGVHFGHKDSKWHPSMEPFIFTVRNGVHIIDLIQTTERLKVALDFLADQASKGRSILFVGTKRATKEIVKKYADEYKSPSVCNRWLGGTITNFDSIHGLVKKLRSLEEKEQASDYTEKYSKRERLTFSEEKERLEKMIGGIREMTAVPDVLFVVDVRQDKTAVREARRKGIPVVAIVDTNVDPDLVDYPIPANDDSVKSVEMIVRLATQAVAEGRDKAPKLEEKSEEKDVQTQKVEGSEDNKNEK